MDKFLTTDVTKPKASKVPFSWHTNRHAESIESIESFFFLAQQALLFSNKKSVPLIWKVAVGFTPNPKRNVEQVGKSGTVEKVWFPVRGQ